MRRPILAAVAAAAVLALSSCAAGTTPVALPSPPASLPASTTAASPTGSAEPAIKVSGPSWTHVHNLAYDGQSLLLGTHEGLYQQRPGKLPQLLSQPPFDVMGLTFDGSRWLASGHPGPEGDLPADLGLRASGDGRSWTTVSLLGEVDFHRLTAQGSTIIGASAGGSALLRSTEYWRLALGLVIVALVLDQLVGWSWADPVLGIVIALWLAWGAFQASSQAIDQLMDKEWPEDQRAAYIEVAARSPGIRGIHDFRTRRSGSHDFAQFHMEVAADLTVAAAHEIVVNVEQRLRDAFPKVEVLIHLDPEGYVDTDNPLVEADVTPHWSGKRI